MCEYLVNCGRKEKYKKRLDLAKKAVQKELDLEHCFRRWRYQSLANLTILDWKQKKLVYKLSKVFLKEDEENLEHHYRSDHPIKVDKISQFQALKLNFGKDAIQKRLRQFKDISLNKRNMQARVDIEHLEQAKLAQQHRLGHSFNHQNTLTDISGHSLNSEQYSRPSRNMLRFTEQLNKTHTNNSEVTQIYLQEKTSKVKRLVSVKHRTRNMKNTVNYL